MTAGAIQAYITTTATTATTTKFRQLVPLLANRDISLMRRGRLYSRCVQSSMLHRSETWPVRKQPVLLTGTLSFTITLHIHLTILISARWSATSFSFLYRWKHDTLEYTVCTLSELRQAASVADGAADEMTHDVVHQQLDVLHSFVRTGASHE